MYVFELKQLPRQADKARLAWDTGISTPRRDTKHISLPRDNMAQFFSLREGNQFLYKPHIANRSSNRFWFGGTDEEPFLVEMEEAAGNAFIQSYGSEQGFYNALVPQHIATLCKETGQDYRRQGDIFGARFCGEAHFERNLAHVLKTEVKHGESQVLGTRHVGKGAFMRVGDATLFRGVLLAPDHAPLNLSDGLYVLGQTRHIVNPTNAD